MPQTPAEADIRGNDYSAAEHDRAVAFRQEQINISNARLRLLQQLRAPMTNLQLLERKWLPLARSSPPYIESA